MISLNIPVEKLHSVCAWTDFPQGDPGSASEGSSLQHTQDTTEELHCSWASSEYISVVIHVKGSPLNHLTFFMAPEVSIVKIVNLISVFVLYPDLNKSRKIWPTMFFVLS